MLAIILLVLAIVFSVTAIFVNESLEVSKPNSETSNENMTFSQGTIQLVVERPRVTGGNHEG